MRFAIFLFLFLFCTVAHAEPFSTSIPASEFVWNKWDTDNFIVLSINKNQGIQLKNKVEKVKSNIEKKYGRKFEFSIPCKIICVPDSKLLTRFFNIEKSKAEVRRDDDKVVVSAIWMDFNNIEDISFLIATICFESSNNSMLVKRGLSELEKDVKSIRSDLEEYFEINISKIFTSKSISPEDDLIFNKSSALICLLLRKEFGSAKFNYFLSSSQDESALKSIYGFSFDSFSKTANRYFDNISKDIKNDTTPDTYLQFEK